MGNQTLSSATISNEGQEKLVASSLNSKHLAFFHYGFDGKSREKYNNIVLCNDYIAESLLPTNTQSEWNNFDSSIVAVTNTIGDILLLST